MYTENRARLDRKSLVQRHNPVRTSSNLTSPIQVGNGGFAFGTDITGLQTFVPFATLSEWSWKNDPLPPGRKPEDYDGVLWKTHGRDVRYDMPNNDRELSQWLIANPNRINLGRIGLHFTHHNTSEGDLGECRQVLDLWMGIVHSSFEFAGSKVSVETFVESTRDTISISIDSPLVATGELSVFLDFPFNDGRSKFSAPYVGDFDRASAHKTSVKYATDTQTLLERSLDDETYYVAVIWNQSGELKHLKDHRYVLRLREGSSFLRLSVTFTPEYPEIPSAQKVEENSSSWPQFWTDGGIIDLSGSSDPRWIELERRIILSQYVMAVNCGGKYPPQESGLVNLGWYGKFHMEMYFWHSGYLALFNKWSLLNRSLSIYARFLPTATKLASSQGYRGARWPKMTDPSGRMALGEINALLIWQQPHPMIFADMDYRAHPTKKTLEKWKTIMFATAEFMASYAAWNQDSGCYDLGPPLHIMSENTDPRLTCNPAFELTYWRYGLSIAVSWWERLGLEPEASWLSVIKGLAPMPTEDGSYIIWPGVENMWSEYNWEHPSLIGIYGWLPGSGIDLAIMKATTQKIWESWQFDKCWGWDFGMLAMNAARSGNPERAVDFLLHDNLSFDDVGLVRGTAQVPTPYFPANGSLLYAVAFMAAGWDGAPDSPSPGFPGKGWQVRFEDLCRAI
jgi:hypothetical protein